MQCKHPIRTPPWLLRIKTWHPMQCKHPIRTPPNPDLFLVPMQICKIIWSWSPWWLKDLFVCRFITNPKSGGEFQVHNTGWPLVGNEGMNPHYKHVSFPQSLLRKYPFKSEVPEVGIAANRPSKKTIDPVEPPQRPISSTVLFPWAGVGGARLTSASHWKQNYVSAKPSTKDWYNHKKVQGKQYWRDLQQKCLIC